MAQKFVLKHPFKVGELEVTEVIIQRPKTKDFIAVGMNPAGSVAADAALLSSITGLPGTVIDQIDIDDLSVIQYEVSRIWDCYFSTKPYVENPTNAEETETPQRETAKTA
ncbi:MAG: phage tail assembly protein [Treponema sp.]|jgi:hypothetical protein|nr:phage tail assembly protein [Treponema sp.]